jgi:23S rRNA G2069 N7-methylase RlmK/C1962 C5-methylase RlmI
VAGVNGHRRISDGLFQMTMSIERKMKSDVQEAALEAAIAGEDAVRWTIDNTPSSLSPGKRDRNWTREMRDSVDSDVKRRGNTITIRTGWLQNKQGYFLVQNDGGSLNGTTIDAMNALMNGHNAILDTLKGWGIKVQ